MQVHVNVSFTDIRPLYGLLSARFFTNINSYIFVTTMFIWVGGIATTIETNIFFVNGELGRWVTRP